MTLIPVLVIAAVVLVIRSYIIASSISRPISVVRDGVMTLRKRVISVLDMCKHFNIADYVYTLDTPIIAVQTEQGLLGLIVDKTDNVVEIANIKTQSYDEVGIKTVLRINDRMLFILDVAYLVQSQMQIQLD